jgi:asparagine synthase (glutamine-hydrolysing)
MCGIAGIFHFDGQQIPEQQLNQLTDAVAHRGPDGRGIWLNDKATVGLGHRRLSILDLSEAGKQPMPNENGRYWITFNGEIYNFLEIQADLAKKGYNFRTHSDTEVILAAYHEWGEEMQHRFNGMWALAIYDTENHSLFISRDRFGVKPLYYYLTETKLIFSSEIQAIQQVLGTDYPLNDAVVRDILKGSPNYHGTTQTYLKDVYALTGGYQMNVIQNKAAIKCWYELRTVEVPKTLAEQAEVLRALCIDACKLRLRSDVPVGTCLSGGLDSGSITAMISQLQPEGRFSHYSHRGFCAAFPNSTLDESAEAKQLIEQLGGQLDVVNIVPPTADELETAMLQCDGFMHALAFFPIWQLYKHIKAQGITVTLDGQGPDEMLGGYTPVVEGLSAAISEKKIKWFFDVYDTYSNTGEYSGFSAKQNTYNAMKFVAKEQLKKMFGYAAKQVHPNTNLMPAREPNFVGNELNISLYKQFFQAPLPAILNQYDRASMASGVECRMPFMDYRIVEFVFSLPTESKVGGGFTKRILREAMNGILPDETRLRKRKIGFNAPIVEWFRGDLKTWVLDQMNTQEFLQNSYFNGKQIKTDFEKFVTDKNPSWNTAWAFWSPLHFVWWQRMLKKERDNRR